MDRAAPGDDDLLAELQARLDENRREAEQREQAQAALDEQRTGVESELDAIQEQIDALVSDNPDEFVIRFIQTEGQ